MSQKPYKLTIQWNSLGEVQGASLQSATAYQKPSGQIALEIGEPVDLLSAEQDLLEALGELLPDFNAALALDNQTLQAEIDRLNGLTPEPSPPNPNAPLWNLFRQQINASPASQRLTKFNAATAAEVAQISLYLWHLQEQPELIIEVAQAWARIVAEVMPGELEIAELNQIAENSRMPFRLGVDGLFAVLGAPASEQIEPEPEV